MKRKNYIKQSRHPGDAAKMAYEKGYFVEAIQILHAWFENQARELVMLVGAVQFKADLDDTWDLTDSFSFHDCIKILFIMNQISRTEYEAFSELNRLRNRMIHDIYKEPCDKEYLGIPKKDFDSVFEKSLKQLWFFSEKSTMLVG